MTAEAKASLKAELEAKLAASADEDEIESIRNAYCAKERDLEHTIDHKVHTFSAMLDVEYKCVALSNSLNCDCYLLVWSTFVTPTIPSCCSQLPVQLKYCYVQMLERAIMTPVRNICYLEYRFL